MRPLGLERCRPPVVAVAGLARRLSARRLIERARSRHIVSSISGARAFGPSASAGLVQPGVTLPRDGANATTPRVYHLTGNRQATGGPASRVASGVRSAYGAAGGALVAQAASSGTNVLTIVLAARALTVREFGAFSIAIGIGLVGIGLTRTLSVEPLLVFRREGAPAAASEADCRAVGTALALGCCIASAVLVAGVLSAGSLGASLIAVALFVPVVTTQDAVRHVFFARRQPLRAALVDTVWGTLVVAWALFGPQLTAPGATVMWGIGALGSGVLSLCLAQVRPAMRGVPEWLTSNRHLGPYYLVEYLVSSGVVQLVILMLAWVSGLDAVAAVRANQTIFGLVNTIFAGAYVALVPRAVVVLDAAPERGPRIAKAVSGAFVAVAAGWGATIWLSPASVGEALFGDTWAEAAPLIVPFGAATAILAAASGPLVVLRSLRQARRSLGTRVASIPLLVVLPVAGAGLASARGFVVGMGLAYCGTSALWWRTLRRFATARDS